MADTQTVKKEVRTELSTGNLADDALIWLEKNFVVTAAALVGVIAITLGWIVYNKVTSSMSRSEFTQVDKLVGIYHKPLNTEGGGETSLEDLKKNAEAGADAKRYENREARASALFKELGSDAAVPKAKGADLIRSFYVAFAQSDANKLDEAGKTFEQITAAKPVWEPVGRLAAYNKAIILSEAGKFEEAGIAFRAIAKDANDDILRNQSLLQAALNLRAAGKTTDARSVLEQLKDMDSAYADQNGVPLILDEMNAAAQAPAPQK